VEPSETLHHIDLPIAKVLIYNHLHDGE